jgi:V/A-type H+-transporting ATPase subunit D
MASLANIKTTRIEMIRTRARIRVASKGLSLLKMKRASLVLEFFSLARQIQMLKAGLRGTVEASVDSTKIADIQAGRINLERIAAEQAQVTVGVDAKNVMGVRIPNIELGEPAQFSRGYELVSIPSSIDDARRSYALLFKLLIEVAEKESSLRKLLYEIEKLNRRSNAIENVVIPQMAAKVSYIKQRLEDMERDQTVSLKFIKRKMDAQ